MIVVKQFLGYEFRYVRGHVEIYRDGVFCGSADTIEEAVRDILDDD